MAYDIKNIHMLPDLVPQDAIKGLKKDGIDIIKVNTKPTQYIININKLISDKINNCKSVFPIWINWNYIKDLFIMPNGLCEDGIKRAAMEYYGNIAAYPYQVYLNWGYINAGNIYYNDKKFVTVLYEKNRDSFTDMSKVTDAGEITKNGIYRFLEDSDKVCVMVDCENSDPYKLYAALKNLDQEKLIGKISKIILYDDIHTTNAWKILGDFTEIPTEHVLIDRVKEDKSLVDIRLTTGTCREFYQNGISSFVIVSSDSDYWGLITSLPDAKFLTMVEWEKCGPDIKKALEDRGLTYCYIDDFCTGNSEEVKISAVLNEVKTRLAEEVNFNIYELMKESFFETRAEISDSEKKQFYDKYIKKMQLHIDNDGNVSVELGRA